MIWNLRSLPFDLPKLRAIVRCADPTDPVTGTRHKIDAAACNRLAR
ncbi:MAG: hypothetical protein H0T46_15320 [Deltaproteobacteria bacterium]|nr:hypothetical protein [Deltaproteobacteria bacterium]